MMSLQMPERCYCADVVGALPEDKKRFLKDNIALSLFDSVPDSPVQEYPMAVVATAERGLIVYQLENQPSEFRRIDSPLKHQVCVGVGVTVALPTGSYSLLPSWPCSTAVSPYLRTSRTNLRVLHWAASRVEWPFTTSTPQTRECINKTFILFILAQKRYPVQRCVNIGLDLFIFLPYVIKTLHFKSPFLEPKTTSPLSATGPTELTTPPHRTFML